LQAWHWPVQSSLQHTPSTQWPLWHSTDWEQLPPFVVFGMQTPALQKLPVPHWFVLLPGVQPTHAVAPQIWLPQLCVVAVGQEPLPSQNEALVATPFVHDGGLHCTVLPGTLHDCVLMPSQAPLQPVLSPTQPGRPPNGVPVTAEQMPGLPGRLHDSHWPEQSLLQHMPSTQNVEVHWLSAVQEVPLPPFGVHTPPAAQ
jgi:hypothetical protein